MNAKPLKSQNRRHRLHENVGNVEIDIINVAAEWDGYSGAHVQDKAVALEVPKVRSIRNLRFVFGVLMRNILAT